MVAYFDSSILLSILKNDERAPVAAELWQAHQARVSSVLLEAECRIVLRRIQSHFPKRFSIDWLQEKEKLLSRYLEEVDLFATNNVILGIIRDKAQLSDCRTLDALHIATALHFQRACDEVFVCCTFDKRMAELGQRVDLKILP